MKDQNIEIYLKEPLKANSYKEKIQKLDQNYFVYTWSDLNKSLFSALKVERNVNVHYTHTDSSRCCF